jgi:hypothetical protein
VHIAASGYRFHKRADLPCSCAVVAWQTVNGLYFHDFRKSDIKRSLSI